MRITPVLLLVAALPVAAEAQAPQARSPYAGQEHRTIKALSDDELQGLREGRGVGFATAAELNHYPGPRHALDLADSLALSPVQRLALRAVYDTMHTAVLPLGDSLIAAEATMDSLFAARAMDRAALERLTRESADLTGRLRNAHLSAHLATLRILTPQQVAVYDRLRGYEGGGAAMHHQHG